MTQNMELEFVNGEHLSIDAGIFDTVWKVHSKWLTWEGAHHNTFCEEDHTEESALFSCDHTVLQLWDIMVSQLIATGKYPQITADEGLLKSMVRSRLSQMPRSVQCSQTQKKGELLVTWKSTDSYQNKDKIVRVVLHQDTCVAGDALKVAPSYLEGKQSCLYFPSSELRAETNKNHHAVAQFSRLLLSAVASSLKAWILIYHTSHMYRERLKGPSSLCHQSQKNLVTRIQFLSLL